MPAWTTRACGAGRSRCSHPSGPAAGRPRPRLAKIDSRISRHPAVVFTIVPSVWNSASPSARRNRAPAAGSSRCQSRIAPPCPWQTDRMVLSHTTSPQNSLRWAAARSNDQLAPARHRRRWASGLTKPSVPRRASSGWAVAAQRGQAR